MLLAGSSQAPSTTRDLLVVDDGPGVWGAQQVIVRLRPHLARWGWEVGLAAPAGGQFAELWRSKGWPLTELRAPRGSGEEGRRGRRNTELALGAASLTTQVVLELQRQRPTLVVGNSYWGALAATSAGRLVGVPSVAYLHEELPGKMPRWLTTRFASWSVAVSQQVAGSIARAAQPRVEVIPNGVDVDNFRPGRPDPRVRAELAADPDRPVVLSIGRLDPEKQIDQVIEAVAGISDPAGVQLAVVGATATGSASHEAELRLLGQRLLGPRVRFLGRRSDVAEVLRAADAVVFAGRQEGMSLGLLEALATGSTVVAYPAAGVGEVVHDGSTGVLVPMSDRRALGAALGRLLGDDHRRRELGRQARAHAETFGLQRQAERTAALLDRVARRGTRR